MRHVQSLLPESEYMRQVRYGGYKTDRWTAVMPRRIALKSLSVHQSSREEQMVYRLRSEMSVWLEEPSDQNKTRLTGPYVP